MGGDCDPMSQRERGGQIHLEHCRALPRLSGSHMQNQPHRSKLEQRLSGLIDCHGFLIAFFFTPVIAVMVSHHFSSGAAVIALILLFWCPFLLLMDFYWGVQAIRKIRQSGAPLFATLSPCAAFFGLIFCLVYFFTRLLLGYD